MNEGDKEAKKEAKDDIQCLSDDIIKLKALKDGNTDWSDPAYEGLGELIDSLQTSLESQKVGYYDEHIEKKKKT